MLLKFNYNLILQVYVLSGLKFILTALTRTTIPYMFKEGTENNINIICDLLKENKYTLFFRKVYKTFPDFFIMLKLLFC